MKRKVAVLAVLAFLFAPVTWAQEALPEAISEAQTMLGAGGSFLAGTPVFDIFAQIPFGDSTAMRITLTTLFAAGGNYAFFVDGTYLFTLELEAFQPYFGGGAGALIAIDALGNLVGGFAVNGVVGTLFPLGEEFGIYGQLRVLGVIAGGIFSGSIAPGLGLYICF